MLTNPVTALPLAGVSILVVDDNYDNREVVQTYLRHVGATVRSTPSADDGLELFKAAPPAVVLADVVMPVHDGVWLLEQIRLLQGVPRVPIIAFTGWVLKAQREKLRAAGFDALLAKPVDLDDMVRVIREALEPTNDAT
jgi:CheY-like chemotaxis protein